MVGANDTIIRFIYFPILIQSFKAPRIFSVAFTILRTFMEERTASKMVIYGYDVKEWTKALLAEIDADQLPACYGGTMTDPDGNPNCVTIVSHENIYLA